MTSTILYIEDDQASRHLVKRALTKAGYRVILAERGLQGIDFARKERPDLILTDVDLPDMSGYEIATALRGDDAFSRLPIVALTPKNFRDQHDIAMAAGITGYLTKPLKLEQLLSSLEFYLQGGQDEIDADSLSHAQVRYTREVVKRLETRIRELEGVNESLSRLDHMKETFIQITAHELRTPLTLIFGYSRLLEEHPPLKTLMETDESARTLIQGLVDAITRMHEVVDEILITSRIITNEIDLSPSPLNLGKLVHKVLDNFYEALQERDLTVYFDMTEWPHQMQADTDMLRLVLINLIGNAIKYTPDGGKIQLVAETYEDAVKFVVQDTGVGIDSDQQHFIFENFHTVNKASYHSTSKTAFGGGGLGLGLPVTKGIIEAHGGKIWVESDGHDPVRCPGSKFFVELPLMVERSAPLMTDV